MMAHWFQGKLLQDSPKITQINTKPVCFLVIYEFNVVIPLNHGDLIISDV